MFHCHGDDLTMFGRLCLPVNLRGPITPLSPIWDLIGAGPDLGTILNARDQVFITHRTVQILCGDFMGWNLRQKQCLKKSVHPGMQTFKSYVVPLTSGVVTELVHHIFGQEHAIAVFFIRASPGEVVVGGHAAEVEAAWRVGFNYTCWWRHVHEEANMNQRSRNTDRRAPYCVTLVSILLSAACRCWRRY